MVELGSINQELERCKLEQDVENENKQQKQKDCCSSSTKNEKEIKEEEDKAAVDMFLVRQFKEMLKNEVYNETSGELNENMSQLHYEEIMDPNSPYVCWRYIKHTQYNLQNTLEITKKALIWHKNNDDELREELFIKEFWHLSAFTFTGEDKLGRSVLFVSGKDYKKPDTIMKQTITDFCKASIMNWERRHRHDLKEMTAVFDVSETGYRNMDPSFISWLVSILDFIPSRIAIIYVVGVPMLMRPIIRMIISLLPERYRKLLHCGTFEELVLKNIDLDQLPVEIGGTYEQKKYRMAPKEAPWLVDSEKYSTPEMIKAINYCIGATVTQQRREELHQLQIDWEKEDEEEQQRDAEK